MSTITRERAEIKSYITGFLSDSAHDNKSSDSLLANVFRIALASLEAEPIAMVVPDEMDLLTCHLDGVTKTYADYSAAIFLIPICISFDTAEKRRYATYLILNRRFSFEF
ncbi:hypothetical protein E3Y24_004089 [Escherichia coli]|nr:hypothetical protein [Escherichia coli]